jgi:hypothetical protein
LENVTCLLIAFSILVIWVFLLTIIYSPLSFYLQTNTQRLSDRGLTEQLSLNIRAKFESNEGLITEISSKPSEERAT